MRNQKPFMVGMTPQDGMRLPLSIMRNLNPENNGPDGWNAEEWDQQQQNLAWLDTGGMAVPDFIITALANIDHFREEAPAWLTLHIPVLTIPSEPEETAPQITEIPSENESEPENPFLDNEPIPSSQIQLASRQYWSYGV